MANILFYLDQFPGFGGIETVTATLSTLLYEGGHKVQIVSHVQDESLSCDDVVPGITCHAFPSEKKDSKDNSEFLKHLIRQEDIQIVVFQDDYARMERNLLAVAGRVKVVVCEHSSPCIPIPLTQRLNKNLITRLKWICILLKVGVYNMRRHRFLYSISDAYVLLSSYLMGEFRAITQLHDTSKVHLIPNVLPESRFVAEFSSKSKKKKQVLFVGSLIPLKRCASLLVAWEKLATAHAEWNLIVVGGGLQENELRSFVERKQIQRVHFEGYQAETKKYYDESSIFALPSRREGFPMVLLEAMASGCVPVSFDSFSTVHEIVRDGHDGIIVPAFDELCFYSALDMLMSNADLLSRFATNARESSKRFSPEYVLPKWETLFEKLLKQVVSK